MEIAHLYLLIIGLLGGFIAGVAGIGTGFILIAVIPVALQHFGLPTYELVKFTIANTIFVTMCSSFMNNLTSILKGRFYRKESIWVSLSAMAVASLFLSFAVLKSNYSRDLYNIIIIVFLSYVIVRSLVQLRASSPIKESVSKLKMIVTGAAAGTVAAFTGLGGGSVVMPLLNLWLKVDIKKAKAITFSVIFGVAIILTVINLLSEPATQIHQWHQGYIIFTITLPLAAGVIISSPIGVLVSHHFKGKVVSYIFLSIIFLVIIRKAFEVLN